MMRSPIGWRRSPQARFSGGNTLWAGYRIYVEGVLMAWTDERIDQLKSMWEKGMTASQIADELGGVSRNAVIGKAHRLGLQKSEEHTSELQSLMRISYSVFCL